MERAALKLLNKQEYGANAKRQQLQALAEAVCSSLLQHVQNSRSEGDVAFVEVVTAGSQAKRLALITSDWDLLFVFEGSRRDSFEVLAQLRRAVQSFKDAMGHAHVSVTARSASIKMDGMLGLEIDLIPCYRTKRRNLCMPDRRGGWAYATHEQEEERVARYASQYKGFTQSVKALKVLRDHFDWPVKSFALQVLAERYVKRRRPTTDEIGPCLEFCLRVLQGMLKQRHCLMKYGRDALWSVSEEWADVIPQTIGVFLRNPENSLVF